MASILLQGGTLLLHDENDHVIPIISDLLIEGNKIVKIESNIKVAGDVRLIDCHGKIVSPGFIDTHRHMWQTQLKGRHANETLFEYLPTGNMAASLYSPQDVFWGQLGAALESLDAGTTTVVDHAHMNYSPEHNVNALSALAASGIRSIFGYCAHTRVKAWSPELQIEPDTIPEWFLKQLEELATKQPYGNGRVEIGLAWDNWYLPKEVVQKLFKDARSWGIKLVTCHFVKGPTLSFSCVDPLSDWGLLGPDILLSHFVNPDKEDIEKLVKGGGHISTTPSTELLMSLGDIVCFRPELYPSSSLGIDCHSAISASIPEQMRIAIHYGRGTRSAQILDSGKTPKSVGHNVELAYNLGTILGARAIGLQDKIGSLKVGKVADIVLYEASSPGMACAGFEDPVGAIVLHASVGDVETVIVDGIVRKQNGKLVDVHVPVNDRKGEEKVLSWKDVVTNLLESREEINKKAKEIDYEKAKKSLVQAFYLDESTFSDAPAFV